MQIENMAIINAQSLKCLFFRYTRKYFCHFMFLFKPFVEHFLGSNTTVLLDCRCLQSNETNDLFSG